MNSLDETRYPNYYYTTEQLSDDDGAYVRYTFYHRMGPLTRELKKLSRHLSNGELIYFVPMTDQTIDMHINFRIS